MSPEDQETVSVNYNEEAENISVVPSRPLEDINTMTGNVDEMRQETISVGTERCESEKSTIEMRSELEGSDATLEKEDDTRKYDDILFRKLEEIGSTVSDCKKFVEEIARRDEIVDNIHAELQKYKTDLYTKLTTPYILQLLNIYENVSTNAVRIKDDPLESLEYLKKLPDFILGIISNCGVETFAPTVGIDKFDRFSHKIFSFETTEEESLNNIISECLLEGFRKEGVTIKPALVKIYKYKKNATNKEA